MSKNKGDDTKYAHGIVESKKKKQYKFAGALKTNLEVKTRIECEK